MVSTLLSLLALAATSAALKVTSPSSSDVWTVGDKQTITWDAVSTDQSTFNIYLSNMASYPSTTILLASDVSSSAGSATVDGSKLTSGNSFTINFTNGTETEQIYAQSNQFNITASSSSSSSSSSSASSTAASSSTSGTVTFTLSKVPTSSAGTTTAVATPSANSTITGSSTATATDASSTPSSTGASSSVSGTASATGSSATASSTATSAAGKIVAGWMGAIALAVMAL